ncbi:MAG TPA: peptidoglycan DD-metalloendopeptidase family protein, partial [Caldilineaceae bacterium]|nr:peptidoglycan DD-metalloendopeptidase family protein [Caldilineaceae bacterium]
MTPWPFVRSSTADRKRVSLALLRGFIFTLLLAWGLLGLLAAPPALAQSPTTYTVQPGDTLGVIATRFAVELERLAQVNGITDVNLISAGQVLVIPGPDSLLPVIGAYPGDALADVAARLGLNVEQLAALNQMDVAERLFPGQPIQLPPGTTGAQELRFGPVTAVSLTAQIVQGQTGRLTVQSSRGIQLTATWNGLPLGLQPLESADGLPRQVAFLPTPALLGPGRFPVEIGYHAQEGLVISRTFSVPVVAGVYDSQLIELPDGKGGLLDPEFTQPEIEKLYALWSVAKTPLGWTEPFSRPIGLEFPTTSPYGTRRSYNGGPYASFHAGQDFGAPAGITVTAPGDGIVVLAEPLNVRGNAVLIDHGAGLYTGYWHLSEIFVGAGQSITVGEALGLVGTTGLSTGNHLHWEMRIYGVAVDPLQFLGESIGAWGVGN